jgi:hypothetical protein
MAPIMPPELGAAGAGEHQEESGGGGEALLVKAEPHQQRGREPAEQQPDAAAHEEVGDRAPQEVEAGGEREQADEVRLSARTDALLAEQIAKDSALNDAVGDDGGGCDEQAVDPGALFGDIGGGGTDGRRSSRAFGVG